MEGFRQEVEQGGKEDFKKEKKGCVEILARGTNV